MTSSNYTKGMLYEAFMKKAFKWPESNPRNGADAAAMGNLLEAEDGNWLDFLPPRDKQFNTVKIYLMKALDKLLKSKKMKPIQIMYLERAKLRIDSAFSGYDLYEVVRELNSII